MKPETELLNKFRIEKKIPIAKLPGALRELQKLFGPAPYTVSRRNDPRSYEALVDLHGEKCEQCKLKPPATILMIASRHGRINKNTDLKDLRLLCRKHSVEYRKSKKD
ncbi:MAG: hypothetical protein WAV48_04505 [Candidatus Magasanikiibacteriota bacterium]